MSSRSKFTTQFKNLKLSSHNPETINILLLGESGTGKSTFINSIINYFHFHKLSAAEQSTDIPILIPCKVSVTDSANNITTFFLGDNTNTNNEMLEVGEAATQDVKTYTFPINNSLTMVRLIDTPGMGDRRGIQQDIINCKYIFNYLSTQIQDLHAICFLMHPKITRLSIVFEYCMKQILSRFDKSAADNIVFLFTNTRASNYEPSGESLACLKKLRDDIMSKPPFASIPLNEKNIFSIDNEGFRYLVAARNKHVVAGGERRVFAESWKRSRDECYRLITRIAGDESTFGLAPHQIQKLISTNEATCLLYKLANLISEVAKMIDTNSTSLDNARSDLDKENFSLNDLKMKLYISVVDLQVEQLSAPATVCVTKKCSKVYNVNGISKWHYKVCHQPCPVRNVRAEVIGDPGLLNCPLMKGFTCQICGCDYTQHMNVYYKTRLINTNVIDPSVQSEIDTKQAAIDQLKVTIDNIEAEMNELIQEKDVLMQCSVDFAVFLENYAISPCNEAFNGYIQYLIQREKSQGSGANKDQIKNLEALVRCHDELISVFELSKKLKTTKPVTFQEILQNIQAGMKHLKYFGDKVDKILQTAHTKVKTKHKDSYVHSKSIQISDRMNKKKFSGLV